MFQFPAAPTVGDLFTPTAGVTYRWNGSAWYLIGGLITQAEADALYVPLTQRAAANGVATLDSSVKVPTAQIPDLSATYVPLTQKGAANGVATLDSTGKVPASQLSTTGLARLMNVNPHFVFDQYREGASVQSVGGGPVKCLDGWTGYANVAGLFSVQRVADPNDAAQKCMEIKVTTADTVVDAGDIYAAYTIIEGYDAAALKANQTGAKNMTIQFAAQSTLPGTYCVAVQGPAASRSYITSITLADTLEHDFAITVPMETSGGAWAADSNAAAYIWFVLMAGSTSQGVAGWQAGSKIVLSTQTNFMATVGNTMRLKRFEVFQGDAAQPVTPVDYHAELMKCQRYFEKSYNQGLVVGDTSTVGAHASLMVNLAGAFLIGTYVSYKVTKRATPTFTSFNDITGASGTWRENSGSTNHTHNIYRSGADGAWGYIASPRADAIVTGHFISDARLS